MSREVPEGEERSGGRLPIMFGMIPEEGAQPVFFHPKVAEKGP